MSRLLKIQKRDYQSIRILSVQDALQRLGVVGTADVCLILHATDYVEVDFDFVHQLSSSFIQQQVDALNHAGVDASVEHGQPPAPVTDTYDQPF